MGYLVPIIGAIASAAGTGLSVAGAAETQGAENKVAEQQQMQQQEFAKRGQAVAQQNIQDTSAPVAQKAIQDTAGSQLAKYALAQGQGTGVPSSIPDDPVASARTAGVVDQSNKAGSEEAGLDSYGVNNYLANQPANRQLGVIGTEAGGAAAAAGPEYAQASQAGGALDAAGSGLGMLGQLASLYGIYNKIGGVPSANPAPNIPWYTTYANQPGNSMEQFTNLFNAGGVQ